MKPGRALAVLLFVSVTPGSAQQALPAPDAARPVYRVSVPRDMAISAVAGAAVLVPYILSSSLITPRCPCDPREVNGFDRGAIGRSNGFLSTASDLSAGLAALAPFAIDFLETGGKRPFLDDAVVFTQTIAINGAFVALAKHVSKRPFPETYAGDPGLVGSAAGYRAFYSGHTSVAFAALTAAAMTMRRRHGDRAWPWVLAGLFGSSVALEMVFSGRHFPTDVIAGAIVGTGIGITVPLLHYR